MLKLFIQAKQVMQSRCSFWREIWGGWRWPVMVVWSLPAGVAGTYSFIRSEFYNSWPSLRGIVPTWGWWLWLGTGIFVVLLVSFEGTYRYVQKRDRDMKQRMDELERKLKEPSVQDAHRQHLNGITHLIEQWCSEISTPQIWEVGIDFAQYVPDCESSPLFENLKGHLQPQPLWDDYLCWETKRAEYINVCKKLRSLVRESWNMNAAEPTRDFEQVVMEVIAGREKELKFTLFYDADHNPADQDHHALTVNCYDVLHRHKYVGRQVISVGHDECREGTLASEFQRFIDLLKDSPELRSSYRLQEAVRHLDDQVRRHLEGAMLSHEYMRGECTRCLIRTQASHKEGSRT
jgi:hypothetical protein